MYIVINNHNKFSTEAIKTRLLITARIQVFTYRFGATELDLDSYLQKNYHIQLRQACLNIIQNCVIQQADENTLIVLIPNKQIEEIARIINFGVDGLCGSNILKKAFSLYK